MTTAGITEGHWTYERNAQYAWTATDTRTGETHATTATTLVDARRFTYKLDTSAASPVRYTIAGGPGRALCARRYTQTYLERTA